MKKSQELELALGGFYAPTAALLADLETFADLMQRWNGAINVVSKSSLPHIWSRHILDSVQIFSQCDATEGHWVDLGSGGGFPGIIVAILAKAFKPGLRVTLIESDQRKAVFLRETSRQLGLQVVVLASRIEAAEPQLADIVSARALAPLAQLCSFTVRHLKVGGLAIFLKGAQGEDEVAIARQHWSFDLEKTKSITSNGSVILAIRELRHV